MVIGRGTSRFAFLAAISLAALSAALGAPITSGNFVLSRVSSSAALNGNATAVFLDEYTPGGTLVQSIAVPTAAVGANFALTMSGSATSEGGLTISPDGRYITFGGYNAAVGTAGIATTTTANFSRVVGRLDLSTGLVDTTTAFTDAFSGGNIRSAVTDGTNVWAVGSNTGVRATTFGTAGTSTSISTTLTNMRRIEIFNGQLYVSSASGLFQGVSAVGTGTPTTTGQTTTLLSGFPTASGPSPYDFWFADANTVYVADDRTSALGGIQKWTQSGGTWSLAYTMNTGLTSNALRGLTGTVTGGIASLYATSGDNKFVTVADNGATSAFLTLVTGASNNAFRGVEFAIGAAIPEPGTFALLGLAALPGVALLRRRK
ncbi:MAG: PEP-CTERM sorting domain-containing protein [Armatimonas sp.]